MIHRPPPGTAIRGVPSGTASDPTIVTCDPGAVFPYADLGMLSHAVLRGLTFRGSGTGDALAMIGPGRDVFIEDCVFDGYANGLNINGHDGDRLGGGVRRCVFRNMVLDGIYLGKQYKGGLYEQNWFENCGDKFIYGGESTDASNVFRGNEGYGKPGMTGGFVCRAGGLIEHNLAYGCDLGIAVGVSSWTGAQPTATVRCNTILAGIGRCIGISLCATRDVRLTRNVIAHAVGGSMIPRAVTQELDNLGRQCVGTVEEGTIITDWTDGRVSTDPLQALYTSRGSPLPVQEGVRAHFSRGGGWVVAT
jgi:hypothetical protein